MKPITNFMITEYGVQLLGMDFMGYKLMRGDEYTYHHIKKRCDGGDISVDNGAVLCGKTSHPYLHLIEYHDRHYYDFVSRELKGINHDGYLTLSRLFRIDDILCDFEDKHRFDKKKNGRVLLKEKYLEREIKRFK